MFLFASRNEFFDLFGSGFAGHIDERHLFASFEEIVDEEQIAAVVVDRLEDIVGVVEAPLDISYLSGLGRGSCL